MPYYTSDLFNFLENLEQNNNREWFAAHKDTYTALRKLWMDDLARMHEAMCQWEPRL